MYVMLRAKYVKRSRGGFYPAVGHRRLIVIVRYVVGVVENPQS